MKKLKTLIVIPARLESSRLPNKPLYKIDNLPMIVQVVKRAQEANIADILVSTTSQEVIDCIKPYGVKGILTDPNLESGTDRVSATADIFDPKEEYNYIINLQGDLPTIHPEALTDCLDVAKLNQYDITTVGALITDHNERNNPNTVKVAVAFQSEETKIGKALYFSRSQIPSGEGPLYQHIGIYGYTRNSLRQFTSFKPSLLEKREKLEQLRALENNLTIGFKVTSKAPAEVNVLEDVAKASEYIATNFKK